MVSLLWGLLLWIPLADWQTPGEEILVAIKAGATPENLRKAGELYRYPASPAEAQALFDAIAAASKTGTPEIRIAGIRALAATGELKAAQYFEPHLREKNPSAAEKRVVLTAVESYPQESCIAEMQWVAPAGCDPWSRDFSQTLAAPGRCDSLSLGT